MLSLRIAVGKVALTLLGLACGASIGREGPTVQVGAAIMHTLGRWLRLPRHDLQRALVLAGGAAGIAAAFNTPLAGIVFAIEELSHSFEARTSGTVFTAVIVAGVDHARAGRQLHLFRPDLGAARPGRRADRRPGCAASWAGWPGGLFSAALLLAARGLPGAGRALRGAPAGGVRRLCAGSPSRRWASLSHGQHLRHRLRAGAQHRRGPRGSRARAIPC